MAEPRNLHHYTINASDMFDEDVSLRAGVYTEVARLTVLAGEAIGPGYGRDRGAEATHGRIYMSLVDSEGDPIEGDVRIRLLRPDDTEIAVVWADRTEDLRQGATDTRARRAFPFLGRMITENYKLVIDVKADSSATLDAGSCELLMSATKGSVD